MAAKFQIQLTSLGISSEIYKDDDAIDKIVRDPDYGKTNIPYFCFGVTFVSDGP